VEQDSPFRKTGDFYHRQLNHPVYLYSNMP
jgi:hypothetical protein